MKKFYTNVDQMKKDYEQERKEFLQEYNKSNIKYKKQKKKNKKNYLYLSIILILLFIIFKISIGSIKIMNGLPYNKSRWYKVSINDDLLTVEVRDYEEKPIIPFFLYQASENQSTYFGATESITYELPKDKKEYILNITSYECYLKKHYQLQTACNTERDYATKKTKDTTYQLHIKKTDQKEEEKYQGKLIQNITPYIKEEGNYYIEITATYKNVESTIIFLIKNEKEKS